MTTKGGENVSGRMFWKLHFVVHHHTFILSRFAPYKERYLFKLSLIEKLIVLAYIDNKTVYN